MVLSKSNESNTGYDTVDFMGAPVRTHVMRFSEEVQQYIIQQLTDLYGDPVVATVRETVSNALDATALASARGLDPDPVEVYTPSALDQVFKVVDHGVGMTAEQLDEYFSDYGNSTKIEDMDAIGSKGLGAKAPLAYTQTFNVETVHDGRRIVISLNRGATANETKTLVDEETDAPNGTIVTVPVRREDVSSFADAVKVYEQYSTPDRPIVVDGRERSLADEYVKIKDIVIDCTADGEPVMSGLWARRGKNHEALYGVVSAWADKARWGNSSFSSYVTDRVTATLGGWRYRLGPRSYSYYDRCEKPAFVVELKPGVVDFPASRDEIKVNDRLEDFRKRVEDALWPMTAGKTVDAVSVWKGLVEKADRAAVLAALVERPSTAIGLDGLLEAWPVEASIFEVSKQARKFKNVVDFHWRESRSGKRIIDARVAVGDPLEERRADRPAYVNWGWSAPFSVAELNEVATTRTITKQDELGHLGPLPKRFLHKIYGKALLEAEGTALDSEALEAMTSPSVNWMKSNPMLRQCDMAGQPSGYKGLVVIADKDLSDYGKKLGTLRAYVRLCVGQGSTARLGDLCACVYGGSLDGKDAEDLKQAAADAGVTWLGVMDWATLAETVKARNAELHPATSSATSKTAVARSASKTVRAWKFSTAGMDRWESIVTVMKGRFSGDASHINRVDLSQAVSDGAIVYITNDDAAGMYSSYNRNMILLSVLLSIKDIAGRDVYIVNTAAGGVPASALKPVADYDRAYIGYADNRLANLKTLSKLPRWNSPGRQDQGSQIIQCARGLMEVGDDRAEAYVMKLVMFNLEYGKQEYAWKLAAVNKTLRERIDALNARWGVSDEEFRSLLNLSDYELGYRLDVSKIISLLGENEFTEAASKLIDDVDKIAERLRDERGGDFACNVVWAAIGGYHFEEMVSEAREDDLAVKFLSDWVDGVLDDASEEEDSLQMIDTIPLLHGVAPSAGTDSGR